MQTLCMTIGVFDSGFGGLSILKYLVGCMPDYSYIYLGDNARAPYGDRSEELIYEFTRQGVEFLFQKDCALVLLACNTASAQALRRLQQEWLPLHYPDRRILGVIIPVVEKLSTCAQGSVVGIIGTRATIMSNVYALEAQKRGAEHIHLIQKACPLLVPIIEEGWDKTIIARKAAKKYLTPFKRSRIDALVLACTHYALMKKTIQGIMGARVRIFEAGPIVAASLKRYLARHADMEAALDRKSSVMAYTTDPCRKFQELVIRFWQKPLELMPTKIDHL